MPAGDPSEAPAPSLRVVGAAEQQPGPLLSERDDQELMDLCIQGHERAFEELVVRYEDRVYGLAIKYSSDPALAADVLQETFLRLWDRRLEYRDLGRFRPYLFQICINCCREALKTRRRHPPQDNDVPELAAPELSVEETLLQREHEQRVERAISKLPRRHREAVLLRFHSELSYAEMARVLGVREATLRSRVFHGLKRLRRSLRGEP